MSQIQSQELYQLADQLEESLDEQEITKEHKQLCYKIILAMRSAAPNIKTVRGQREVLATYEIEDVIPYLPVFKCDKEREYLVGNNTFRVKMFSDRYRMFLENMSCVRCGIVGSFFRLERMTDGSIDRAHFNLYGIHPITNEDILMTKDHVLPKSKGGKDKLCNYQTMCTSCNNDKGNELESNREVYASKFSDWFSKNNKWVITIDRVTAYNNSYPKATKYAGRAIDLISGREIEWEKSVNGNCTFQNKLPQYIKNQIISISI